jgi:predicted ferric reductase
VDRLADPVDRDALLRADHQAAVMLRRPYRVAEVRGERGDTWTLVMPPDSHPGFRFRPGQFGWLTVWGSPFKITGRPFSFSSSAAVMDGRVEMSIRNLGEFTSDIHNIPAGKRAYLACFREAGTEANRISTGFSV